MEITKKTPIHIGLFGHIDSGKTAIASVLSEIISTAGIDGHPQSKQRGITIDLGFTSFLLENYLVTLVDAPGHADLIKISISSVEIIDCALVVIDINKGPQKQTGEHLIMIEALSIKRIIVVLNKIDLFKGNLESEIEKTKDFFNTTSFGKSVPIYPVSAKSKTGFEELKEGILKTIKCLEIKRDLGGELVLPIDHHFPIKGLGAIITGTILKGIIKINQIVTILPINSTGKVKSIQIFRQSVESAKAGDRVGINVKNLDVKKIYRGCYATTYPDAFKYCEVLEVRVNNNKLFKPEIHFGSQVHITIGMFTTAGNIYPYYELDEKKIQTSASSNDQEFKAILWLNEKILIFKKKTIALLSRLDLPPTTLRIIGSAELLKIYDMLPLFYKYKTKVGRIMYPDHAQGIVCIGLAQSSEGARKLVGKTLEQPFSKILGTFGTKGGVIVGTERNDIKVKKGDKVFLKELRSFSVKKI